MGKKKLTFEKKMARLEEIVERLESGEATLDETIRLFEEGKQLGQQCRKELAEFEKKIQMIVEKENGEVEMVPFADDAEET